MAKGLVITAPASGTGKTSLTFGLLAALRQAGTGVQGFKVGPDYIDPHYHALASGRPCPNLDPWAMEPQSLRAVLDGSAAREPTDLCLIEGVMGLFDGAAAGGGSTADLARSLGLPVILVLDVKGQSQSVAALVQGFARFDPSVRVAGLIFNRVGSDRHEALLRAAVAPLGLPVVGALPRLPELAWPSRHLGLTLPHDLPAEGPDMAAQAALLAQEIRDRFDLPALLALAETLPGWETGSAQAAEAATQRGYFPPGTKVAIARDAAFAFTYPHWLSGEERFFSPLNNEAIPADTDFVFLPGGYPELHAAALARADAFWSSLRGHQAKGGTIYGECGGYMALGQAMTVNGKRHDMGGLLPLVTHFTDGAARTLGYRSMRAPEDFWLGTRLKGHEFHASRAECLAPPNLFHAEDSRQASLGLHGHKKGNSLGSYLHIIDRA